ncbi:MAG: response regulator [Terrimonas sp.]|nr:response regulator [Terrimonas sp.]
MQDSKIIRCLIVDDEPLAREIISRYIAEIPSLELVGEFQNALQAFAWLQQHKADLIFLDIRMPQLNGNDFLKTLKNPPRVIFTTAYTDYALEGYELDVADYLMKPIPFERFLKAVNKAFPQGVHTEESNIGPDIKNESFVYFRVDRKMVKVMLHEIQYIESMKDYIKVHTAERVLLTKQSISSVEAMLPESVFIRVHRSFIVSLNAIKSFTSELLDIGNTEIPVGKLYRQGVMKMLQ